MTRQGDLWNDYGEGGVSTLPDNSSTGALHPPQSFKAVEKVDAPTGRLTVLKYLASVSYATDEAICKGTTLKENGHRARRGECAKRGWVEKTGAMGLTSAGNAAALWRITEKGREQLRRVSE